MVETAFLRRMTAGRLGAAALVSAIPLVLASAPAWAIAFVPGDLVVSVYGNGDGSGAVPGNAASPIVLQQLTTSGARAGSLVLPQSTTVVNGTTQYVISGEYGSSSEGLLQRSADGKSLVIAGYGVSARDYNAATGPATYGGTKNGQPALAQTTSVPGGSFTAVPRVVANIGADGTVDTSTALYNIFDGNNPRSVATVNGSSFYLAGQGTGSAVPGGVYVASKGASGATAIDTSSDYRVATIANGTLYASRDYNGASGVQYATVDRFATALPTGASAPTGLNGIGPTLTLTANGSNGNGVNASRNGTTVYLSPESYFFANDTTLYIADSGNPKNGNVNRAALGEGGLQKWTLTNGTWSMQYDITAGLGIVKNAVSNTVPVTTGTSGLIGLTGRVVGNTVFLYATNATLGDTDQTYVFSVADSLTNMDPAVGTAEAFTTIYTAAPGTIVRGIAFAPEAGVAVPEPASASVLAGLLGVAGLVRRRRGRHCRAAGV